MNELKPCPFCGGEIICGKGYAGIIFFKCPECRAIVSFDNSDCELTIEAVIEKWNRRENHEQI